MDYEHLRNELGVGYRNLSGRLQKIFRYAMRQPYEMSGLPVGLQLVGRPQDDLGVLQLVNAFEKATRFYKTIPGLALAT